MREMNTLGGFIYRLERMRDDYKTQFSAYTRGDQWLTLGDMSY